MSFSNNDCGPDGDGAWGRSEKSRVHPESPAPQSRSLNEGFEDSAMCPTHSDQLGGSKGQCYLSRAGFLH